MDIMVNIPDYDGEGIDIIWNNMSQYMARVLDNEIVLSANREGLISIAKQLLYMAYNDLPNGSHVHYDDFFARGNKSPYELIITKLDENS